MNLHVCLVRTEYASNIGSVARAMANMGGDRLILIDPKCKLSVRTKQMAAGAQDQLKKITRYKNWDEFYKKEGAGLRIAFSRRGGKRRRVYGFKDCLKKIKSSSLKNEKNVYLIFGPEADGLDIEDLAFVNYCCHLPIYGEFGSLNLSHAVLLALFIANESIPPSKKVEQIKGAQPDVAQPFYFPDQSIREWLTAMGFDINARKSSAYLTLKKLFLQNLPSEHELHVLESILRQNIRKLKAKGSTLFPAKNLTDDV